MHIAFIALQQKWKYTKSCTKHKIDKKNFRNESVHLSFFFIHQTDKWWFQAIIYSNKTKTNPIAENYITSCHWEISRAFWSEDIS